MFSSSVSNSRAEGMELHPLTSKLTSANEDLEHEVDEEKGGAFRRVHVDDDDEELVSGRYTRIDSIDETGSERIGLMPHEHGMGKLVLPDNNLDVFFRNMYEYYLKKGFGSIISTAMTNLTSILFTIGAATFFLTMFNWSKLADCRDDERVCEPFSGYIESPFTNRTLFKNTVVLGSTISIIGWFRLFLGLFFIIASARKYRHIYRYLDVSTRDLQTMQWSSIVTKLRDWNKRVIYVKNDMSVNAFTIALRIMRKENYKIAFFCLNILPLGSPDWPTTFAWVPYTKKYIERSKRKAKRARFQDTEIWWMGNMLEYNLDLAIFNSIVDETTFQVRRDITPRSLKMKFKALAVLNLIFLPLVFLGTFVYSFFRYAEEFHSKRNYLGPRWWTPHAVWIMREFNELPHVYTRRLNGSLRLSEKYLKMFPSPVPIVLARGAAFILGGLVAILLVFALVDDAVLLHVTLWDRNLVWYAAILSSALAAARALIPPPEEESPGNPNVVMRKIASFTHLLPDHWRGKAHTYDVKETFEGLFPFRFHLLVRELISVIFTPYLLWTVLPEYADDICQFMKDYTTSYTGVGDVCTFSLMNLERDGDPKWNKLLKAIPLTSQSASIMGYADDDEDDFGDNSGKQRKRRMDALIESKLEKSWITFKVQYSPDNCGVRDSIGEDLLRRVKDFQAARKPQQYEQNAQAAMLMSSSLSTFDNFQLVPPPLEGEEEEYQGGAAEDLFWFLEQFRDEEMRKRLV